MRLSCSRTTVSWIWTQISAIFERRYDAILASREESRDALASVRGTPYRRVARLHYDYIKKQRAEVESMLNRLSVPESSPAARTIQ